MSYSHRFFLYGPVALFLALVIAVMGYWWVASSAFSKRLDQLNGHEIAPGVHFSFAQKSMGGFPFRVDSVLDGLRVEIATSHGPTVWTSEHFAMHALTYGRLQGVLEAAGNQAVTWHDDRGQLHEYDFLPGSLRASAIVDGDAISRFDLQLIDAASADVSAAHVELHLRKDPKIDGFDLATSADGVHMSPDLKPAFGPDVKHFAAMALLSPGSSFERLLAGHADWRVCAENWRMRHGGLLVNRLEIVWGKLNATGSGALSVDALHRPLGVLDLQIANWQALLQQAGAQGLAKEPDNGLAAGFLAFAAGQATSSDQPLKTKIAMKDGVLYIGTTPADLLSPFY
jgi:hypothetical protein